MKVKLKVYQDDSVMECIGILNNNRIIYKHMNNHIIIDIQNDTVLLNKKNDSSNIKFIFKKNETTICEYEIFGLGITLLNIKTEIVELKKDKILVEYEIIESKEKHKYSIEYEVI